MHTKPGNVFALASAALLEAAEVVVGLHPSQGVIFWNRTAEQLTGWTGSEVSGGDGLNADWIDRGGLGRLVAAASVPLTETGRPVRCLLPKKSGGECAVEFSKCLHHRENGDAPVIAILMGRAVAARPAHDPADAIVVDSLVHDLNNHFTLIAHTTEIVPLINDPVRKQSMWGDIIQYCDRGRRTVQRLRGLGGQPSESREVDFDLRATALRVVTAMRHHLPSNLALVVPPEHGTLIVAGNETEFEKAMVRLLLGLAERLQGHAASVTFNVVDGNAADKSSAGVQITISPTDSDAAGRLLALYGAECAVGVEGAPGVCLEVGSVEPGVVKIFIDRGNRG